MKPYASILVAGVLCALGAVGAAPASAQSSFNLNRNLEPAWQRQSFDCSAFFGTNPTCYTGINGLTYARSGLELFYPPVAVVQPDGKLVVGGTLIDPISHPLNVPDYTGCVVERFEPNGTLDTSFGYYGVFKIDPNALNLDLDCRLNALALAPDGSIYLGAQDHDRTADTYNGAVYKLDSSGTEDILFGTDPEVKLGDNVNALVMDGDNVIAIGSYVLPGYSDDDFRISEVSPDGSTVTTITSTNFDLGGGKNDRPSAGVLESFFTVHGSGQFPTFDFNQELYVVGTAQDDNWAPNHPRDRCAVAALRSVNGGAWNYDTAFGNGGTVYFDLPVQWNLTHDTTDTQTLCYAAVAQGKTNTLSGIVVGGERNFNHAAAAGAYDNSAYALAAVSPTGQVTALHPNSSDSSYLNFNTAGQYNSVRGIVRQYQGKYLVAGLAGAGYPNTFLNGDMGTAMLDADFSYDPGWGLNGINVLSLDGLVSNCPTAACTNPGTFETDGERANALVLDPRRGRAYVVGTHYLDGYTMPYDAWLIGVVRVSDRIFADNLDGTSPND